MTVRIPFVPLALSEGALREHPGSWSCVQDSPIDPPLRWHRRIEPRKRIEARKRYGHKVAKHLTGWRGPRALGAGTGMAEDMARLEDLTPGTRVRGIVSDASVEVVATAWHGTRALTLTYRTDGGQTGERIVYRDDEPKLDLEAESRAWAFDGDGRRFRLVSEARRIRLAYLFDPMLAVHLSAVRPLPHQIQGGSSRTTRDY
jgi:hypothetical protein